MMTKFNMGIYTGGKGGGNAIKDITWSMDRIKIQTVD